MLRLERVTECHVDHCYLFQLHHASFLVPNNNENINLKSHSLITSLLGKQQPMCGLLVKHTHFL